MISAFPLSLITGAYWEGTLECQKHSFLKLLGLANLFVSSTLNL